MNNFEDFLMDSFEEVEEIEREITIGGKKKKMKFKPISADKGDELRKKCKKIIIVKGQKMSETDQDKFIANQIIETTTYPDLKNAELQKAWGVMGAEQLLKAMKSKMSDGEYMEWGSVVSEINGYDKGIQELVEEAKN
ncbi:phage tail assembly chaperone [Clostridium botulinum]|uniref:phage tail assembly chaperone n=1 Tax=Clostridium botulinum TaxID=1491 RepID=UPI003DA6499B